MKFEIPTGHLGVALSGGADSVALLVALHEAGCEVTALHCNFGLRGDESDGDELYCRDLCARLGVPIRCVRFDVEASRLGGESIEMTCRRLRYDWFARQARDLSLTAIALAHHREDAVETLMLNLLRGSGPKGLCGMPRQRGIFIRPMLDVVRPEIEKFLAERGISYRTDSTNLTSDYRRNALRNEILPAIRHYFPAADAGIIHTMHTMGRAEALIDSFVQIACRTAVSEGQTISIPALRELTSDPASLLYLLARKLYPEGITLETAEKILAVKTSDSRIFPTLGGMELELFRGRLFPFQSPCEERIPFNIFEGFNAHGVAISAQIITPAEFKQMKDSGELGPAVACFDADKLPSADAILRHRLAGDKLSPLGMPEGTSRKISDLFTDSHLSASAKNRVWLLTLGPDILWVPHLRQSSLYSVSETTARVLMLKNVKYVTI